MKTRISIDVVAFLIAVVALGVMVGFISHGQPPLDRKLHRAIGQALARESLRLVGDGGQILLITRDTETFPQPALDTLLRAFARELRRARVPIAGTQLLQTDPLRPAAVPPGDFYETIRRAPVGHVIVSLLGPPLLSREQRTRLGAIKPKIVAFCSGTLGESLDLPELFNAGLLHAAVVIRPQPQQSAAFPAVPPSRFEELYATVTATSPGQNRGAP